MSNRILSDAGQLFSSQSLASDLQSAQVDLRGANGAAVDFQWSSGSSLSGTLNLKASTTGNIWNTLASASITGASGSGLIEYTEAQTGYMRLDYSKTSGTGNLDAYFSTKWE